MAKFPTKQLDFEHATTNATPSNVTFNPEDENNGFVDIALSDNSVYYFRAFLVARDTAGTEYAWVTWLECKVRRQGGAAPATTGTITGTVTKTAGMPAAPATYVFSGNNLRLQVTGIVGTTINWGGFVEYFRVS
jgi:hypothetical protein